MEKLHNKVRVTEIGDVAERLVTLYKGASTLQEDDFLKKSFEQTDKFGKQLVEAVKRDAVLSKLDDADIQRDQAIRVLSKLLSGYEVIPIESLQAHGSKLAEVFNKYGLKIIHENYSSQSNLIESLLSDLQAESLKLSVEALAGVSQAIANVRKGQDAFAKLRAEYEQAIVQRESLVSATKLRKPLLETINKTVEYLSAMQMAYPEKYDAFVGLASQVIKSVNNAIKARGKKSSEGKEQAQ